MSHIIFAIFFVLLFIPSYDFDQPLLFNLHKIRIVTLAIHHLAVRSHNVEISTDHHHAHVYPLTLDLLQTVDPNVPSTLNVQATKLASMRSVEILVLDLVASTQFVL